MTSDNATFELPPVMKLEDCQQLHSFLEQSAELPIVLDCSAVTRLGGLGAQIIQMAHAAWDANDLRVVLADPTPECRESLNTLGLSDLLTEAEDV